MSAKINVTFVDDLAGTVIGTVDLSPDALPPSFEQDTTLYIGDADWTVVDAQPSTSAEFIAQGSLTLRLSKVESVDPKTILFSVPSFVDMLPQPGEDPNDGTEFEITEDDWRQIEMVSATFDKEIESQIASILEIHQTASQGGGWTKVHVRDQPLHPISEGVSWSALLALFPGAKHKGLTFRGQPNRIENSFSVELSSGFFLYGLRNEDQIIVLGLDAYNVPAENEIKNVGSFLTTNQLRLVDWCRCNSVQKEIDLTEFFKR